jgi:hypothetical protein
MGSTDSSMECLNCGTYEPHKVQVPKGTAKDVESARRQGILKSTALKRNEQKSKKER